MNINSKFPDGFLPSLNQAPGFDEKTFKEIHQTEAPTSIRINPDKAISPEKTQQVPWCPQGYYLNTRPSFTFDPLFHAGCYYVQEASSMFIDYILKQIRDEDDSLRVLDLCAAPGGKSTLLSSALGPNDLLVANEIIKARVPILADNLNRWGHSNVVVTNNDPKTIAKLNSFFDVIVVDAPCSGSGMFRKDAEAMEEWSEANVLLCQQRQERILADIYPALAEDGYLIYSTCSYSVEEDEAVLDWLCHEFELESVQIQVPAEWGIVESQSPAEGAWGYRFYPNKVKGEGLFAACLRKKESSGSFSFHKPKSSAKPNYKEMDIVKAYTLWPEVLYFFKLQDDWLCIDRAHRDDLEILQQYLYIKKAGIRLGKLAGQELIPDHELALSLIINKSSFLQTPLTYEQAIAYLRRDNLVIDTVQKGWSLMTYKGFALGWAKLLPNRVNNYYPKELRILAAAPLNADNVLSNY